jgi:protein gp37
MADNTKIEWTDATWNPITGCQIVSPGCTNCYAMKLAGTRLKHEKSRIGLTKPSKAGPVWTGEVRFNEGWLDQPLRWKRPRTIFVCAHGDLFADGVKDEWIDKIFAVMALAPQHTFQVLTKRPERMREYLSKLDDRKYVLRIHEDGRVTQDWAAHQRVHSAMVGMLPKVPPRALNRAAEYQEAHAGEEGFMPIWPLPNVWLGVSVEDQTRANERIPVLLDTPAAVRWISAEPLLGPLDLTLIENTPFPGQDATHLNALEGWALGSTLDSDTGIIGGANNLDWVVAGGESGAGARPMHPDWVRSLRAQCAAASVAFHFKQWGEWVSIFDRDLEDPDWKNCGDWPEKYPTGRWINLEGGHGFHGERVVFVNRVGKAAAGRHIYGTTHDAYPTRETA